MAESDPQITCAWTLAAALQTPTLASSSASSLSLSQLHLYLHPGQHLELSFLLDPSVAILKPPVFARASVVGKSGVLGGNSQLRR